MQTKKKIPMRMCIGCGEHKPKRELVRVVKNKEGNISLDLTGKAQGRGAYVCRKKQCVELTIKKRLLNRSFKTNLDVQIYEKLGEYEQNN